MSLFTVGVHLIADHSILEIIINNATALVVYAAPAQDAGHVRLIGEPTMTRASSSDSSPSMTTMSSHDRKVEPDKLHVQRPRLLLGEGGDEARLSVWRLADAQHRT